MNRIKRKGYTVEIGLGRYGYKGYSVECTYQYDKDKEKYLLHIGLKNKNMDGFRFGVASVDLYDIDAQYISGTKETILYNIDRIVEYAATHEDENHKKFFDKYIKQIDYMYECCERGNECLEEERFADAS